jgi:hypothetical protein
MAKAKGPIGGANKNHDYNKRRFKKTRQGNSRNTKRSKG